LKEKAEDSLVNFVVDVDNVGHIRAILEFWNCSMDAIQISFFVKNNVNLEVINMQSLPSTQSCR
jgi:hypothetical protein